MAIEQGSMRQVIKNIYNMLITDEQLLRLLTYLPKNANRLDPLDEELPNIIGSDEYWEIIDKRVMLAEKTSDLVVEPICRIYISAGRRRPVFNDYLLATQEISITTYVHENYEIDMRTAWISDRIQELLALEYVNGSFGRLDYVAGNARIAPNQYKRYDHTFEYVTKKK